MHILIPVIKWILLVFAGTMLCFFFPLGAIAPLPFIFCFLLYGRISGFASGLLSFLLVLLLIQKTVPFGMVLFVAAFPCSLIISEFVFRKINPAKGVLYSVMGVTLLSIGISVTTLLIYDISLRQLVTDSVGQIITSMRPELERMLAGNGVILDDLIGNNEKLVEFILRGLPQFLFLIIFVSFWFNTYLILKNFKFFAKKFDYQFSSSDLLNFKVPKIFTVPSLFIVAVILGDYFLIGDEYFLGKDGRIVCEVALFCFGLLYFVQGMGVVSSFLKNMGVKGAGHIILIVIILIVSSIFSFISVIMAIFGMLDSWINYRSRPKYSKYLK